MPVSIAELEAAAALGWRAPDEVPLGRWLLRAADGFTGRANSALAAGDPGMSLADAVASVRAWYAARGLPAMIAAALARAAVEHGAARLYLQVEEGNQAARALYARSGFTDHHGYHYRVAPAPGLTSHVPVGMM